MFDPVGSEYYDEFIEVYNRSLTETIDLANWQISDSSDADFIISHTQGTLLQPGQFAIILDPGYFSNSHQYDNLIPPDAFILTIDDAAFGSNGLSNSQPEPVILISSSGDTVAKYRYSPDNQPGYSDEKRNLLGNDSPENWANSRIQNGTPGFTNSTTQIEYDVKLDLQASPSQSPPGQVITLIATVTNIGVSEVSNFQISFFEDVNFDAVLSPEEQVSYSRSITGPLKSGATNEERVDLDSLASGLHFFYAQAECPFDQDHSNNIAESLVKIGFRPGQIIINEIMYRPAGGQAEWIELYNPTDKPVILQLWQFSDSNTNTKIALSDSTLTIPEKGFLILSTDSTIYQAFPMIPCEVIIPPQGFPALNNTGDEILLYDPIGAIIDHVKYETSWGSEAGISLERRRDDLNSNDPSNWALSQNIAGGTPGFENSTAPVNYDLELTGVNFNPANPFPGQELSVLVEIANVGRLAISEFQLSCFIDLNQDTLFQENERIGEPILISQNLDRDEATTVTIHYSPSKPGCYRFNAMVFFEKDAMLSNNSFSKMLSIGFESGSVVINEIMYSPLPGQLEWIELFNPHHISIDIQNWSVSDSDSSGRQIITKNLFEIAPQAFLILAPDSSILNYDDLNGSPLLTIKTLPRLNDDLDQVFIFDANNNIIDEVSYRSSWGGDKGISLERINPNLSSKDSSNWSSCVSLPLGGTPGRKNSIFVDVLPTEAELSIAPNPFSPDDDGRDDVTIISYQLPFNLAQIHVKIFDIRGRLVRFLVNNQPSGTNSSIIWDGRDNEGHSCRMGIYIVYLEAIHHKK
ncbi:lamin tail domain-containing protein, partial [candidate division KSB1 bacterium]|nr:lamin tail domain-containing protein [candidate division KSB1 bacterium]